MSTMNRIRNPHARAALLAALGLLLGGSLAGAARAQQPTKAKAQVEAQERVPYKSSIQVPYDSTAKREGGEAHRGREGHRSHNARGQAEAARYQKLAGITADQARSAALAKVPGTAKRVKLENEEGNLVYSVKVMTPAGKREVMIDAGNGNVLQVEQGKQR
ncbi:MAG TPA: PepSY domain-containing protein [Solirubrobacteraceae bacterium]|jgi:uncharacterized membrane protein YkoI|nr:PepSY domain-containing protein [Solirubrobacteraceae bacterium]